MEVRRRRPTRARRAAAVAVLTLVGATLAGAGAPPAEADGHNTRSLNTHYDAPVSHYDTANIRVHYTTSGEHATTAAYAEKTGDIFQDVWDQQVEVMGWKPPAADGDLGGDERTDVYLRELSTLPSIAHAMVDRHATADGYEVDCDPDHCEDVSGFVRMATGLDNEEVLLGTAAHEFNHLSQYATAYHADRWMMESTALWIEGELLPRRLPNYTPVDVFAANPDLPLAQDDNYDLLYASWVWNRWLADRHGPAVVRDAWTEALEADQEALGGYDVALGTRGSSVAEEFLEFAAATAAWRTNDFPWYGFSDDFRRYFWPQEWDVRRESGEVAAGDTRSVQLDHTAYALYDLAGFGTVEVQATAAEDIAGGVALVADRGFGDVTTVTAPFVDGTATLTLDAGTDDAALTAVVVNADPTVASPFDPDDPGPVEYAHDDVSVTLAVDGTPPDDSDSGAPRARDTDDACPSDHVPDTGFADTEGNSHENAIHCVVWWAVASGRSADHYAPALDVNREQMATFVANLIVESGGTLPDTPRDHFTDDDGSAHELNINRLAEAGVVAGSGNGRYAPRQKVYRDQMATFLVKAYEHRTGATLTSSGDYFTDDDGNTHEPAVNAAAEAGFTGGSASGDYLPRQPVRRDQMASFLARALDLLVEEGEAAPPSG